MLVCMYASIMLIKMYPCAKMGLTLITKYIAILCEYGPKKTDAVYGYFTLRGIFSSYSNKTEYFKMKFGCGVCLHSNV